MSKAARDEVHKRYLFDCCCVACADNWTPEEAAEKKVAPSKKLREALEKARQEEKEDLDFHLRLCQRAFEEIEAPSLLLVEVEERLHRALLEREAISHG